MTPLRLCGPPRIPLSVFRIRRLLFSSGPITSAILYLISKASIPVSCAASPGLGGGCCFPCRVSCPCAPSGAFSLACREVPPTRASLLSSRDSPPGAIFGSAAAARSSDGDWFGHTWPGRAIPSSRPESPRSAGSCRYRAAALLASSSTSAVVVLTVDHENAPSRCSGKMHKWLATDMVRPPRSQNVPAAAAAAAAAAVAACAAVAAAAPVRSIAVAGQITAAVVAARG